MASCFRFQCDQCGKSFSVWDDLHCYYISQDGNRKYAYHPNHSELEKCTEAEYEAICLACGVEEHVNVKLEKPQCNKCGASELCAKMKMDGQPCPDCNKGVFRKLPGYEAVS